ncbi:MAG: TspO/MBR family protein [Eubacteriales bacterium]
MMEKIQWKYLIGSIIISLGVGNLAGILTRNSTHVYESLYKPEIAPPSIVFPIVWTILFIFMGISAYLVFVSTNDYEGKEEALQLYWLQLVVNFFWSIIFFRLEAYWFAFVWLVLLWVLVFITTIGFYKINKIAGVIMIPYLIWLTFAGYLNFVIAWYA